MGVGLGDRGNGSSLGRWSARICWVRKWVTQTKHGALHSNILEVFAVVKNMYVSTWPWAARSRRVEETRK